MMNPYSPVASPRAYDYWESMRKPKNMAAVFGQGERVWVRCGDDIVRAGTVTGHFRERDTQMHVVVVDDSRWDGYFSEQAIAWGAPLWRGQ